jgi:hypothetical protein
MGRCRGTRAEPEHGTGGHHAAQSTPGPTGQSDDRMQGSMLSTEQPYGDVIVEAEVRFTGEIDSGIMLKVEFRDIRALPL